VTKVAIYAEDKLFMDVQEILVELLKVHPEIDEFIEWTDVIPRDTPCLVLGNLPPVKPARYVKTLSQKQLMVYPTAMSDLQIAIKNLLTPKTYPKMQYRVVDMLTPAEERALGDLLVVDIETGGQFDVAIRPEEKYLLCVGMNDGKNIYVYRQKSLQRGTAGYDQLIRILTKPGRKLIAHNMKFDFPILGCHLGISGLTGHGDTMLMHHSINHGAKTHKLEDLAVKYLGAEDWKDFAHEYTRKSKDYATIPKDVLHYYNALDVYWTWHLYHYLLNIIKTEPERLGGVLLHEYRMSRFFQVVEANGTGIDLPYLQDTLREELVTAKEAALDKLKEITGEEKFNPGSPQQVKRWLQDVGYKMHSTKEDFLLDMQIAKDDQFVRDFVTALLDYRGHSKMLGTYVDGVLKRRRGNVIYPTFNVHGTATGRLSSSDPNIQNIPRDKTIRRLVVPRSEGRTMVQADYSQAELRVMACLSGDEYLQSLFQIDSPDFFDALMPIAFPGTDLASLAPGPRKQMRAKLKGVIYGMSYGRQAAAIAKALTQEDAQQGGHNPTTIQQANVIMRNYFKQAPDLYKWRQWVSDVAIDPDRTLISPYGRMYQAELVTARNRQNVINSGLAFLPQSTASDMCVEGAFGVQRELSTGAYGDTMIVATIHDAILLDVPDQYVDSVTKMVPKYMEEAGRRVFGDTVVFAADTKAGPSWADVG
jgi:DNA polymerase-1